MPGPANFNTPARIIRLAGQDAGLLQEGSDFTPEQYVDYMSRLNEIINVEQTNGIKLWLQYDLPVTLVAGQALYSIFPTGDVNMTKPMRVIDSNYYMDSNGVKRPILLISRDDYARLSQVTQEGQINSVWPDKKIDRINVSFWLVPDANAALGTAHLCIQQQAEQLIQLNDTMTFPQEWFIFLHWALSAEICTGQPDSIVQRCEGKTAQYRTMLENWDVEDAPTQFQPDSRILGNRSFV